MESESSRYGAKCQCGAVYNGPDGEKWLATHTAEQHPTADNAKERFAHFATVTTVMPPDQTSFSRDEVAALLAKQREAIAAKIRSL